MPESRDLEPQECLRLLQAGVVGRVALSTPDGPHIIPVNYTVFEDTVVTRTSPYSVLGTYGRNAMLAFEVDHIDHERHVGWSVVARGRGWAESDPAEITRIRQTWQPRPWATGNRNLYLRIRWETLTGRRLGSDWTRQNESPVHRSLSAL
jgi:nitroimidazol reductase NimA-like FMN-containing flavoprotein (pyridoxamine 5'-phosphate oxidase superfamily)